MKGARVAKFNLRNILDFICTPWEPDSLSCTFSPLTSVKFVCAKIFEERTDRLKLTFCVFGIFRRMLLSTEAHFLLKISKISLFPDTSVSSVFSFKFWCSFVSLPINLLINMNVSLETFAEFSNKLIIISFLDSRFYRVHVFLNQKKWSLSESNSVFIQIFLYTLRLVIKFLNRLVIRFFFWRHLPANNGRNLSMTFVIQFWNNKTLSDSLLDEIEIEYRIVFKIFQ